MLLLDQLGDLPSILCQGRYGNFAVFTRIVEIHDTIVCHFVAALNRLCYSMTSGMDWIFV